MKSIHYSTKAKKDLKKYRNDTRKMKALFEILSMLAEGIPLPPRYKMHELVGNYKGCFECHVENDFLLIWFDVENDIIEIIRIGSHSELF